MKRGFLSEFADLDEDDLGLPQKRTNYNEPGFESFGPIPITTFNPMSFPENALVYVHIPEADVNQAFALPLPLPLPLFQPAETALLCTQATLEPSTPPSSSEEKEKKPKRKPKCKVKLSTDDILKFKDVRLFPVDAKPLPAGITLDSLPESRNKKRRIVVELLQHPLCWAGVAVSTFEKQDKTQTRQSYIFTENLFDISQYVRPLGFQPGMLVLPSNAICYTSFNKGNHQVTYILTDMFVFNDVKKALQNSRFNYGMTVLKKFNKPKDVQYCFMVLMSLTFHLFRVWCKGNACARHLLDPSYKEPSFDSLCSLFIQDSKQHLSSDLTLQDMAFLLERSDILFKKLVELCLSMHA